jgi:hypothetical protein
VELEFEAPLWRHRGDAGWYFVTLPPDLADDVRERSAPGGFGSVRVTATVGAVTWQTSLFPHTDSGSYVLPVKQQVRRANGVDDGDAVRVRLALG